MTFHPIASYGFIGNLGSCALVGKNCSIDWCCLPRIDSPSIFAAIIDPEKGGSFSIAPADPFETAVQEYHLNTNVLRTEFSCDGGTLEVTDWMHMSSFSFEEREQHRLPALYRLVRCLAGKARCRILFDPRLDYARGVTTLSAVNGGLLVEGTEDVLRLHAHCPFTIGTNGAEAVVTLEEGDDLSFICTYGNMEREDIPPPHRSLEKTIQFWNRWSSECEAESCLSLPLWKEQVTRSALVLKILAGGKGIAAAATASLPEIPGGKDNWDYRFNWMRDTSFTIQALTTLGHLNDAREFLDWITDILVTSGRRPADLKVLYPLHGTVLRGEEELPHLRGYLDSRPVRIGNGASEQRQHDIYGEILEAVFRSEHLHPGMDHALSGVLRDIVDYVCEIWREPDNGIWELRAEPQHYIYSKVMCWVALDRGIRLAEEHHWNVDSARWQRERAAIREQVMEQGYSEQRMSFVQAYGSDVLDATALLFPILEFLSPDHPHASHTLDTIQRELADGVLVYRSSMHHQKEGAFGFCSFWLVNALAFAGRVGEARTHFEKLLQMGNHLGLYAEEIDATTGAFLGNFPQAFTHVGLINSAIYLSRFLGAPPLEQPLIGEKNLPDSVS
ncbi:glycoside hydrolase family 15 protein [Candidatus Peregrinibacteria bacterium]|nr:glycoside hydrolase family 15 protein [Candidatus Peregrinibacteria bacterium]